MSTRTYRSECLCGCVCIRHLELLWVGVYIAFGVCVGGVRNGVNVYVGTCVYRSEYLCGYVCVPE